MAGAHLPSSACCCLVAGHFEKTALFLLNYLGTFVENQLATNVRVYFGTLNSILLIHMSTLMLVLITVVLINVLNIYFHNLLCSKKEFEETLRKYSV